MGSLGALLGLSWGSLGALLASLGALLGLSWGSLGVLLRLSWALGALLRYTDHSPLRLLHYTTRTLLTSRATLWIFGKYVPSHAAQKLGYCVVSS